MPANGSEMPERRIMDAQEIRRSLSRIAHEILERNRGVEDLVLVGIHTRGVILSQRLEQNILHFEGNCAPLAELDINLYRDDLQARESPRVRPTKFPVDIHGKNVVLVDDVLFTGRTIRAALDALSDLGRPRQVQLAILVEPGPPRVADSGGLRGQERTHQPERRGQGTADGNGPDRGCNHRQAGAGDKMTTPDAMALGNESQDVALTASASTRRNVLDLDDFTAEEITSVLDDTGAMVEVLRRDIKKVPTLRGRVVVTMFYESSTRTRISFEEAGKVLSADVINMSSSGSSVDKGESLLNTGLTIQAMGVDVVIIRHPHSGAPYLLARHLPQVSVINAGDGMHAHPTQALLDLYTMREKLGSLHGSKVVIVGDVLHSRVARSDLWGLTRMGAQVTLCGPTTLIPLDLLSGRDELEEDHPFAQVDVDTDLDRAIEGADVVMALRLQSERQQSGFLPSLREYIRRWQVTEERLARAKPGALVMHPGPMNEGVEISTALAHGENSVIEEQVTNGVAVRMALLYRLCAGRGNRIGEPG